MKVVVYGATGHTGSRVVTELTRRGHTVVAVARHPESIPTSNSVTAVADDLSNINKTAAIIHDADAVVSAIAPPPNDTGQIITLTDNLVRAIGQNGGPRLIVVGGAASLFIAPGLTLLESGHLPEEWRAIATSHQTVLQNLRRTGIDWTYFSPAAFFAPGERTGAFRLGKDDLIVGKDGVSRISMEDYAIALVDELENPKHAGQRFTIGY